MSPRRFVVLGGDHWHAPWHIRALREAGGVVASVSASTESPRERLGLPDAATVHRGWRDALDAAPDAVAVVLTPPDETPEVLDAIIAQDRPLVLEKPGTVDAAALEPAASAAAAKGLLTAVPFVNRFADFWRELGRVPTASEWTHAHFRILAGPPARYLRDGVPWVLSRTRYGGGALRNLGIHAADAASVLAAGGELRVRSAMISNRLHGLEVEDFAAATLETDEGRTITIEAGYAMPTETTADKEWRVHGPGWAVAESNGVLSVRDSDGLRSHPGSPSSAQYLSFGHTMTALAADTAPDFATVDDLLRAQHLIDGIYQQGS